LSPFPHTYEGDIRKDPEFEGGEQHSYLALQIKRRGIRVRPLCPQLRSKRTQRIEHLLALSADRRHDAHAKVLRRVGLRGKHSSVVMNPGIYEQSAAAPFARAEAVDATGLDVDACDLGAVVGREDRELYGAAPRVRREDRADVLVARTSVRRCVEKMA
jgi:hypothetical protein